MVTFTTISDIRNWVDSATTNWDDRTDEQVDSLVGYIHANIDYGRDAEDFLATLPDNLADLID
jgi:hypothetical protein